MAEVIFNIPGIGNYAVSAVQSRDYLVVQAYVLFTRSGVRGDEFRHWHLFCLVVRAKLQGGGEGRMKKKMKMGTIIGFCRARGGDSAYEYSGTPYCPL